MSSSPLSDVPMSESGKIHDELASNVGENPLDSSHAECKYGVFFLYTSSNGRS